MVTWISGGGYVGLDPEGGLPKGDRASELVTMVVIVSVKDHGIRSCFQASWVEFRPPHPSTDGDELHHRGLTQDPGVDHHVVGDAGLDSEGEGVQEAVRVRGEEDRGDRKGAEKRLRDARDGSEIPCAVALVVPRCELHPMGAQRLVGG